VWNGEQGVQTVTLEPINTEKLTFCGGLHGPYFWLVGFAGYVVTVIAPPLSHWTVESSHESQLSETFPGLKSVQCLSCTKERNLEWIMTTVGFVRRHQRGGPCLLTSLLETGWQSGCLSASRDPVSGVHLASCV
jgi:hypothetical protein